jgi:intein/homing endonuclease
MANGLSKSIGQIGVGDMVAAFKGAAPWVARRVTALVTVGTVKPTICIDGVYVTRNHRFLRPDETWTRAEDLKPGDEIVRADGTLLVVSGMWEGGNRPVYNFTVDELHTYIAGGMRVHNMKDAKGGRVRISRRPRNPHLALRLAA